MPSADKAVLIARVLKVTVEYLVTGNNDKKPTNDFLSPELRSIIKYVEPLSREKRKIIQTAVIELANLLRQPMNNEPVTFTPLQRVFLQLFQK